MLKPERIQQLLALTAAHYDRNPLEKDSAQQRVERSGRPKPTFSPTDALPKGNTQ